MNTVLRKILETNTVTLPDSQTSELHSHIPHTECEIIQAWIATHHPQRILEIGLAYGISALYICDALQAIGNNFTYHIIDAFQSPGFKATGLFNLDNAGFEDVYAFHEERSEICLPQFLTQGMRFDFALIDGNHTFDHTLVDFFYVNRMLDVGGIVIFDDIQLPSIQKVVAHIA
ncbi:MAG: class I SAM-dependent methyltransferase, partial [Planctomycetota bacterium]